MLNISKTVTDLLRMEITGNPLDRTLFENIGNEEWKSVYRLSKSHDIAHLIADIAISNNLVADMEIAEKFKKQLVIAVYRYKRIQNELETVKKVLDGGKIPFIPLKGSVIRDLYPQPWMRTSCDIDILVRESNFAKATEVMEANGYSQLCQTAHDISFVGDSKVHVELHRTLIEEGTIGKAERFLDHVWDYAEPKDGSYEYLLKDAMFYYYHLAHMAKHLENGGGCGIRTFIDLWILNKQNKNNTDKRNELLALGGLDKFAEAANELTRHWFENGEISPITEQLEQFIITGGVYGTSENSIIMARGKNKSKFKYLLKRIWLPYSMLIGIYPNLRGKRILQPFYEVRRWAKLFKYDVFKSRKNEFEMSISVSNEKANQVTNMLSELGIK